jgi:Nucleotide-diphospho-sugar transferase
MDCGILYMGFGAKAELAILRSAASLKKIRLNLPVCVVGDRPVKGADFIRWDGESPFDTTQRHNFQFRAGRIKPRLYKLSPFKRTMYIDADTTFIRSIQEGFSCLDEYDAAVTEENLTLAQLYNKQLAGWEINLQERDVTVAETGGDATRKFINSGVLFFKKNTQTEKLFDDWHTEWMRFQQWDEQLSLIRAIHSNPDIKVKRLSVKWNNPQMDAGTYIYHTYGRGVVRMDVK